MKYIKENYNTYYKEISEFEWLSYEDILQFNTNEIKEIENLMNNKLYGELVIPQYSSGLYILSGSEKYYLYKIPDEWYLISSNITKSNSYENTYYKCDQIEGILKFIKDKL